MFNFNPELMQIDGGAEGIGAPVSTTLTRAQQQAAVRKLAAGQTLTDEEKIFLGIPLSPATAPDAAGTPDDGAGTDAAADAAAAAADAAAKAAADKAASDKAAADKAAADKAAAEAAAATAKTAAELAAAKAALDAANKALADANARAAAAKAAADRAAADAANKAAADRAVIDEKARGERQSAYDLLFTEFSRYGLGSLVEPLKGLIQKGVSPSEFTIELRNSPQYQRRFAANAKRIANGLTALNEAQYIGLEDQYQNIMRNYGLPEQYYARGDLGVQQGFEQFIGNDVSPVELEDRIQTAERRVRFANPEVGIALRTFYPDITNGDVLAYALDPKTALESLKRRITAAEVGSTAVQMGLATNVTDAEYLARYGVTKAQAQQGYQTISSFLPRAQQLSSIYSNQGVDTYTQATAEKEVFGVPGAAEAARQRKKIVDLETAAFSGSAGAAGGALARERAGGF